MHHLSCDGKRPCSTCTNKRRPCFDYNPKLTKAVIFNTSTVLKECTHATTTKPIVFEENNRTALELSNAKKLLHQKLQRVKELEQQNQQLKKQFEKQQEQQKEQFILPAPPRNRFVIDLWNLDSSIANPFIEEPTILLDCQTFLVIGCNDSYCNLTGFTKQELKDNFNCFNCIPERIRSPWQFFVSWMMKSPVKFIQGSTMMKTKSSEFLALGSLYVERSFMIMQMKLVDCLTDEQVVNDIVLPATYRIPASQLAQMSNAATPPEYMFQRLLTLLRNLERKAVYTDDESKQERFLDMLGPVTATTTITTAPPKTTTAIETYTSISSSSRVELPPVQLSTEELVQVASRIQHI
jgi:hypothetical protein